MIINAWTSWIAVRCAKILSTQVILNAMFHERWTRSACAHRIDFVYDAGKLTSHSVASPFVYFWLELSGTDSHQPNVCMHAVKRAHSKYTTNKLNRAQRMSEGIHNVYE